MFGGSSTASVHQCNLYCTSVPSCILIAGSYLVRVTSSTPSKVRVRCFPRVSNRFSYDFFPGIKAELFGSFACALSSLGTLGAG